jgi:hypothetical protein
MDGHGEKAEMHLRFPDPPKSSISRRSGTHGAPAKNAQTGWQCRRSAADGTLLQEPGKPVDLLRGGQPERSKGLKLEEQSATVRIGEDRRVSVIG